MPGRGGGQPCGGQLCGGIPVGGGSAVWWWGLNCVVGGGGGGRGVHEDDAFMIPYVALGLKKRKEKGCEEQIGLGE